MKLLRLAVPLAASVIAWKAVKRVRLVAWLDGYERGYMHASVDYAEGRPPAHDVVSR